MSLEKARTRFQLIYSLVLLVIIPAILILNTTWWVHQSRSDIDVELQDKVSMLSTLIAGQIGANLGNPAQASAIIESVIVSQPDIKEITVYKADRGYLVPVASSRSDRMKDRLSDLPSIPAWNTGKATFAFGGESYDGNLQRVGSMQYPLLDTKEKPIGLINTTVSFAAYDQLAEVTFNRSILILFGAVVLIVLLLANHFRMIESTVLLQKLKEVDRMKDDFISMASHELRTPLTAIKGYASMLLEGSGGQLNEKGKHYLDVIMLSSNGLDSLVADMLDVSRIEQGRLSFDMEETDLVQITKAVADQLLIPATSKGLSLEYKGANKPVVATVDSTRMRQILFNLIGNAIKYTEKGAVTVSHGENSSDKVIVVKDTGIGMSEEDRKKLFNKFYRIRNEHTEKITGTGLGLWITEQLVLKMGGKIRVDSEVGKGTTVTVTFP